MNLNMLLKESKKEIEEKFKDYSKIIREDYDDIDTIELYLKVKYRDNIASGASNSSFRTKLNLEFEKACSRIQIRKKGILTTLSELHDINRNNPEHFNIINNEINNIIKELRRINNKEESINAIETQEINNLTNSLGDKICRELIKKCISDKWQFINLYKDSLITEWRDGQPYSKIQCKETYMLTDKIGNRESNVGCYIGKTLNDKYILIPQGVGYINKMTNSFAKARSEIFDDETLFINAVIELAEYLRKTKEKVAV